MRGFGAGSTKGTRGRHYTCIHPATTSTILNSYNKREPRVQVPSEPVVTRFGPPNYRNRLRNGPFWDQKQVQKGSTLQFSECDQVPIGSPKRVFFVPFEHMVTHFSPPKALNGLANGHGSFAQKGSKRAQNRILLTILTLRLCVDSFALTWRRRQLLQLATRPWGEGRWRMRPDVTLELLVAPVVVVTSFGLHGSLLLARLCSNLLKSTLTGYTQKVKFLASNCLHTPELFFS